LRDKNKRKRFEVRYDVEAETRKEGMAQFERDQQMKVNKISMKRYKEQLNRGFDILTNDPIDNDSDPATAGEDKSEQQPSKTQVYEYYRNMQEQKRQPRVWSKAMNTVNREFMTEDEKLAVEADMDERKKVQLAQSKAHLTQMLRTTGLSNNGDYVTDINGMQLDRRSQRVRKIFGEVIPSPSATVTEKLAHATV